MKERITKIWKQLRAIIPYIFVAGACFLITSAICMVKNQEAITELEEAFDSAKRSSAVDILNQRKGQIEEIHVLDYKGVPRDILREELQRLCLFDYFTNPYLKDIVLYEPETSDIGDICEEIISQIDDHIHRIKYGKKDEQSSFFLLYYTI